MNEFDQDEYEALRKMAKERIAYDTIFAKWKNTWVWGVGAGLLGLFLLWDKIHAFIYGVK